MGLYTNSWYNANNTGWWLGHPSEKYEFVCSVGMMKFPTEWKVIRFMFQSPPTSLRFENKLQYHQHKDNFWQFTAMEKES